MLKLPQKLEKGDTIGLISPAGEIKSSASTERLLQYLEKRGYKAKILPNALEKKNYLAGGDEQRLLDLHEAFLNSDIKAILCLRGGYGTFRLLDKIDWKKIGRTPKIFAGYSDITALLNNFLSKSGFVCFHSPLGIPDFGTEEIDKYTEENFWDILEGKISIPHSFDNPLNHSCIIKGEAKGKLIGGNLSILCGLLGTPYFPDTKGKIIILEDVSEPLYKIDRMLTQLKLARVFEEIAGVLIGEFTSIPEENADLRLMEMLKEIFEGAEFPVGYGFCCSHSQNKTTLPLGLNYLYNSSDFRLEILNEYVL